MLLISGLAFGQSHDHEKCGTDQHYQQQIHNDPSVLERAAQFEADYQKVKEEYANTQGKAPEKFIIPVVFHVFHVGGPENISWDQIKNQIDTMNRAFNGPKFDRVRQIFWGVAADCEIEFRLATKDPNGNCTDGVVRIYDPETENATNNIKLKSAWPTDRYFNVWVVKDINSTTSQLGTILGYAQFPWFGGAQTDGVVIRSDNVGSIGTATNPSVGTPQWGSTLVHEAGHWLGLYHPFQDSCFGGDQVEDTPPVEAANFNCDYNANSCSNETPDMPDMVENYMDYAPGPCMGTFTIGQKLRMHTTMKNWRPKLWLPSNLEATGTADPYTMPSCAPRAYFYTTTPSVCKDGVVNYRNNSFNTGSSSAGIQYSWEFPGGNPSSSSATNPPNVQYSESGWYDVTLIASNTNGSDTFTRKAYIQVHGSTGEFGAGLTEGFEFEVFPVNGWSMYSTSAVQFERVSTGEGSIGEGTHAIYVRNGASEVGARFYLESPTMDLSMISNPVVTFHYAHARRRNANGSSTGDVLIIQTSSDCGKTWTNRKTISAVELSTTGTATPFVQVSFFPSGLDQWKVGVAELQNVPTSERNNVKIRFEHRSFGGNNLFIDNINLGFNTSLNDLYANESNFTVYPNPSSGNTTIHVFIPESKQAKIEVLDIYGRTVSVLADGQIASGEQDFTFSPSGDLSDGIYFVRLTIDGQVFTRKLMLVQAK